MTYFTVYISQEAQGLEEAVGEIAEESQDLFNSKASIIKEENGGYSVMLPYESLPNRQDARILLAHIDTYLDRIGASNYLVMFGVDRVNTNNLFVRFAHGENVNGSIEKELEKVFK